MHESSPKRIKTQRNGETQGLLYHFNKGFPLFGLQRTMNYGKVTRQYKGKLTKEKGYFNKVCL